MKNQRWNRLFFAWVGLWFSLFCLANPDLEVSPARLHFAPNETSLSFTIRNADTGTLTWRLSANRPWITVQPGNGSTATAASTVTVTIDRSQMSPGITETGTITVTSNGGNETVSITVVNRQRVEWPLAPRGDAHVFDHGIGGDEGPIFHGALDLPAPAGTDVFPMITGVVMKIQQPGIVGGRPDTNGAIWIAPDPNSSYSWLLYHITDIPRDWKTVDQHGAADATRITDTATAVGKVADWPQAETTTTGVKDHVHIMKVSGMDLFSGIVNPLHELNPAPTLAPVLGDLFFEMDGAGSLGHDFLKMLDNARVIRGNVDMVVHAATDVTAGGQTERDRAEINALSYRIEGEGNVAGHDVSERFLFDFTVVCNFTDSAKKGLVYDQNHRTQGNHFYYNYFVVTNCGNLTDSQIRAGNDAIANVLVNAWQTAVHSSANDDDAMDGANPDRRAILNGNAKYPDGNYRVTIRARTFSGSEAETSALVYSNNHTERVGFRKSIYKPGDPVYVNGEGFQGNRSYAVYVIKKDSWYDHAPIPHGTVVTSINAISDSDGMIPETLLWSAYTPNGVPDRGYDVVVDYDGDGEYHLPREGNTIDALNHIGGIPEIDVFTNSLGRVVVESPLGRETVSLMGPATVHVKIGDAGEASDLDGDGLDQVSTEIVEMRLTGYSAILGKLTIRVRSYDKDPFKRSEGEIEETKNLRTNRLDIAPFCDETQEPDCRDTIANSWFDVYFEVDTPIGLLHTRKPKHMTSIIHHKPPEDDAYQEQQVLPLYDEDNNLTDVTISASHHVPQPGEEIVTVFKLIGTLFGEDRERQITAARKLGEMGANAEDALGALGFASRGEDSAVAKAASQSLAAIQNALAERQQKK